MTLCDDPYGHRREGRDAARYHRGYTSEHSDMMRERDVDDCAREYADAYDSERRRMSEREEEERMDEERRECEVREHQRRMEEEAADAAMREPGP